MTVTARLPSGETITRRTKKPASKTIPLPKRAWEERWWFPIGSVTRVGDGVFRWHSICDYPNGGGHFILSGRLKLLDGVGFLRGEDVDETDVDEDPSDSWYEKLPRFPYAHLFFDEQIDVEKSEIGPWCCMHGHYGLTRASVEMECSENS